MKIWIRLSLYFLLVATAAMTFTGMLSYFRGKEALEEESFNRLTAVRELKATQIEDYFGLMRDQILTLSSDPTVVTATHQLEDGYNNVFTDLGMNTRKMMSVDKELNNYFEGVYLKKLNANLDKKTFLATEQSPDSNCRVLQNIYMVNNPFPVSEKHRLDSASDRSTYSAHHHKLHPFFRNYMEKFGYYDIFLIDIHNGNIIYTVYKEVDFGTSLETGPFRNTNLARVYNDVKAHGLDSGYFSIADYEPYHPSYNQHAAFIGAPIIDHDTLIGVLAFQLPIDKIDAVMTSNKGWQRTGLGTSGETYLVGNDYKIRNQSRFLIEDSASYFRMISSIGTDAATVRKIRNLNTSIGLQEVKTEGTEDALKGNTATRIFNDYRGIPVLSSYRPVNIAGLNWVIMSEIDESEAFSHIYALRWRIIAGCGILLVLVLIISYMLSRSFSRPLKVLSIDAMEVAKGNFNVEIDVQRKDEIGMLATSFRKKHRSLFGLYVLTGYNPKLVGVIKAVGFNVNDYKH